MQTDRIIVGDAEAEMGKLPAGCVDWVITDPPYGVGKAAWDVAYPDWLADEAFRVAPSICVMPGLWALPRCITGFGLRYRSVLAGLNSNGMTFGPVGFNNWIPAVVGGEVPRRGQDACRFVIAGDKPEHPSPKPLEFMLWLVDRLTDEGQVVLDPFIGSGTTAVACVLRGRHYIGIELNPDYAKMSEHRIAAALNPETYVAQNVPTDSPLFGANDG